MNTNPRRFWMLAVALLLVVSQGLGQTEQPISGQGQDRLAGGIVRLSRGDGVAILDAATIDMSKPVVAQRYRRDEDEVTRAPRRSALHYWKESGEVRMVPQDFTTIQAAIDASNDGDTVLVSRGVYYENIRFKGKAIVVASLFLADGDIKHIMTTIIDGSKPSTPANGSAVSFVDGEGITSLLCGFTIRGGTGTRYFYRDPNNDKFWLQAGGGVFFNASGGRLTRNIIAGNRVVATCGAGGGIAAFGTPSLVPNIILEGNTIRDNYVESNNYVGWWSYGGGGIFVGVDARIVDNVFDRNTVTGRIGAAGGGLSIEGDYAKGVWTNAYIAGNIFRSNVAKAAEQGAVGGGLLVAWTGEVSVLNNLFEANEAASTGGNSWAEGGGMCVTDQDISGYGQKMIMHNQFLKNTVTCNTTNDGGGMLLFKTWAMVCSNRFEENAVEGPGSGPGGTSGGGGGAHLYMSSFIMQNNILTRNSSAFDGGGLMISGVPQSGTEQVLVNNTVVENSAVQYGGGLRTNWASNLVLFNDIFWRNHASSGPEIVRGGSIAGVHYNVIRGGWRAGTGNLDSDPLFVVGDPLYNIRAVSPCIASGVDSLFAAGRWYYAPTCDCDEHPRTGVCHMDNPDIGAQERQSAYVHHEDHPVVGVKQSNGMPSTYGLEQNYPNPFNPSTVVRYQLPEAGVVRLVVYDILGREVATLLNEEKAPGNYEVEFNASALASGIYIYRLTAGQYVETKRMVLTK